MRRCIYRPGKIQNVVNIKKGCSVRDDDFNSNLASLFVYFWGSTHAHNILKIKKRRKKTSLVRWILQHHEMKCWALFLSFAHFDILDYMVITKVFLFDQMVIVRKSSMDFKQE